MQNYFRSDSAENSHSIAVVVFRAHILHYPYSVVAHHEKNNDIMFEARIFTWEE